MFIVRRVAKNLAQEVLVAILVEHQLSPFLDFLSSAIKAKTVRGLSWFWIGIRCSDSS